MATLSDIRPEKMVREPTIPERINETLQHLVQAHAILDRLDGSGDAPSNALPESLVQCSAVSSETAARLVSRLYTLFGQ